MATRTARLAGAPDATPRAATRPDATRSSTSRPREFADRGYAGARVDEIAARTRTTKRMIYYYFGGKEQLYVAVLERAYATHPQRRAGASTSTTSIRSRPSAGSPSSPSTTTRPIRTSSAW